MPQWEVEQRRRRDQRERAARGYPELDISESQTWRETTDLCVIEALAFYGTYLCGQTNGMSDALSLPSVVAACEIEQISMNDRPELARRMIQIHGILMEIYRTEERIKHRG